MSSDLHSKPALVLGASGGFGGAMAQELIARGWHVRLFGRSTARLKARFNGPNVEIVNGDGQYLAALSKAAAGCGLIVHGVNYPYHQWVPFMQTATQNVIKAAQEAGGTILFPGNVYSLGPGGPFDEAAPHRPSARKGVFRARLEGFLRDATKTEGDRPAIRVLIVRAGDFFGPSLRNGVVDRIYGNAARGKTINTFGRLEIMHERVFLPDHARAALDLLSLGDALPLFEVVNVTPATRLTEREFLAEVARVADHPGLKVRIMPWVVVRLIGLFNPVIREFAELAYLYDTTVLLSGDRLKRLLPDFRFTPLDEALKATIESYRA
ncbi:MAG: NAD-dependent epimerase/dehydratase family protein [Alphaproteobacteria bacterium]|nr:NAD-dependent epimerase/dehydratase family protein [Alphaproteobacteria bacterium]